MLWPSARPVRCSSSAAPEGEALSNADSTNNAHPREARVLLTRHHLDLRPIYRQSVVLIADKVREETTAEGRTAAGPPDTQAGCFRAG